MQGLAYVSETIPSDTGLVNEVRARGRGSTFALVDGTAGLAWDRHGTPGSTGDSAMIVTAVEGEAQCKSTRVVLVAVLTVLFDAAAMFVTMATLLHKTRIHRWRQRLAALEKGRICATRVRWLLRSPLCWTWEACRHRESGREGGVDRMGRRFAAGTACETR